MGANMDRPFRGTSANSAIARLASASGLIAMAVYTQVRMVSNPQIQKRAVLYVRSIVLLVCCLYKLPGEIVTCRGGFVTQYVSRRSSDSFIAATLDGLA